MTAFQQAKRQRRQYILARTEAGNAARSSRFADAAVAYRKAAEFASFPHEKTDCLHRAEEFEQAVQKGRGR